MHFSHNFSNQDSAAAHAPRLPEKELLLAVLDRSVLDYHGKNKGLKKAAAEWIFEEANQDDCPAIFSFSWICDYLELEKGSVRECIRQLNLRSKPPQGHRWLRSKVKRISPSVGSKGRNEIEAREAA